MLFSMLKHSIHLTTAERRCLREITNKGSHPARVMRRASILLKSDEGMIDAEIARHVGASHRMVVDVRTRCALHGVDRALHDAARSGRPVIFHEKDKAKIVALACTDAPEGQACWTLGLLAEQAAKCENIHIGTTKVWTILKEHDLKPWRKKNVVHPEAHA
jgi:transposase